MATLKAPAPREFEETVGQTGDKLCPVCRGQCVRGDFSSVANFGVTREPHFVTSYGWMQVKYDRATPIDAYMCLKCGLITFYGREPLAVLGPIERQQYVIEQNPELGKKMELEKRRRKELEKKGQPLPGEEHTGV